MKSRGRFVQHQQLVGERFASQVARQLDALRFPTGEGRRRLPQGQIAQADILQGLQDTQGSLPIGSGQAGTR